MYICWLYIITAPGNDALCSLKQQVTEMNGERIDYTVYSGSEQDLSIGNANLKIV